jgi:hypothetical protein
MSTLAKDFNVGSVQGGHYQRMDVTLTWDSEIPMEFRLHMWQPSADGEGSTVIWSVSRDLLVQVTADDEIQGDIVMADVWVDRVKFESGSPVAGADWTYLRLSSDDGQIRLGFSTKPLAAFVRSSLAMCPTESEALDVDGLITQIFHAEEAQ